MPKIFQKINFSAIHPNIIGAVWLLGSVLFFQISYSTVKFTGEQLGSVQIVFLRSLLQSAIIMPFIIKAGCSVMKTTHYKDYACRLIFGVTNIVLTFYAYTHMHLATATAIVFTRPLFTIPLAALMLKENVGWKRGVATLIGFIGIVMVLNPGPMGLSFPETAALGASFMLAVTYIYIQKLSRTENHLAMLLYFGLACSLMTAYPAYCQWTSFGLRTGICLLIIAGTATAAQYCVIRAYQIGKATVISPIDYLQIPLSAFIGWCFFHETLSLHFIAGVIIIIATSVYILKRRAGD